MTTFDPELADRIREVLGSGRGVDERRMFGGLAFLLDGNIAVAAIRAGGLMVRACLPSERFPAASAGTRRLCRAHMMRW